MINFKLISKILGMLLIIELLLFVICIAVSLYYKDGMVIPLAESCAATATASAMLLQIGKKAKNDINKKDGCLIVTLVWLLFSAFGMLPFYLSGYMPSVTNCFFETMSGFTTTGASILDDIESLPPTLLFWRSLTQWIGGFGIVFFTLAFLPIFGMGGMQLFAAETTGITHNKVHPKVGSTAKRLWSIYLVLTVAQAAIMYLQGMPAFDSVCHAMTTTSTGGYSTKQSSIAYYNSPGIEYTVIIFMILSGINFSIFYLSIFKGKIKEMYKDTELRYFFVILTYTTLVIAGVLHFKSGMPAEEAFRKSLFQVASLQTSTGFATDEYTLWPQFTWPLILMIMIVGACAGSTAGGLKCVRLSIIIKIIKNELIRVLHPNAVPATKINGEIVKQNVLTHAVAFIFAYFILIFIGWVFFINFNVKPLDALFISASSVSNVGPAIGEYGPSFSWNALPDACKWFSSLLMLIGRLEIFTVLMLFTTYFWKKH